MAKDNDSLCGTSDNYPRNNSSYLTSLATSISCTENSLRGYCRADCDNPLDDEHFMNIPQNCPCMEEKHTSGLLQSYSNQNNTTPETLFPNVILAQTSIEDAPAYQTKDAEYPPKASNQAREMPKKTVDFVPEPDNFRDRDHSHVSEAPVTNEGAQTNVRMGSANSYNAESVRPHSLSHVKPASSQYITPRTSANNNNQEQQDATEIAITDDENERGLLNSQYSIEKKVTSFRNSNLGSTNLELLHDPSDEIILDDNFGGAPLEPHCHCLKQIRKTVNSKKNCPCMETVSPICEELECPSDRTAMSYNSLNLSNQYDDREECCHCANREDDSVEDSYWRRRRISSIQTNSAEAQCKDTRKYSKCKSNEINVCNRPVEMTPQLVKYIMGKCREACPCKPRTNATIEGLVNNMDNCLKELETTSRLITVDMQNAIKCPCSEKSRNIPLQTRCPCIEPRGQAMANSGKEDVREYNRYNTNGIFGGKGYIEQEHGFYFQGKSGLDQCCQTQNYANKCVPHKVCCRCMADKIVQDLRTKDLLEKRRNLRGE